VPIGKLALARMQNPSGFLNALRGNEATMSNRDDNLNPASKVVWLDDIGGESPEERVLSLENVARMFGVSKLVLRYYEFRGLIGRRRMLNGVPVFGWADCERIAFIVKCRKARLRLGDILAVIDATEEDISPLVFKYGQQVCMSLVGRLEGRRRVMDEALAELSHVYALLTSRLVGGNRPPSRD
jgi:DNA-binding transcriptional MerR regulator